MWRRASCTFSSTANRIQLEPGDLITVPPDVPHSIQLLSAHVRLVDTFTPIREPTS